MGTATTPAAARAIIDANAYMTLATADGDGAPWASPVWFAHDAYVDFVWVSRPDARHSRNLAVRPQVGIVVFDSTVPIGNGRAVYMEGTASVVDESERERLMATFSERSLVQGGHAWSVEDVTAGAPHRLYRARASAHFILDERDHRVPVRL
jgi:nitroimidazol reductase NimA-like FMN-containing flavoprotein (pyridoxamine 5'-phosphate oxidase superfamily)